MKSPSEEFASLMARVRSGSDDAARELISKYGDHILRAIRRRLSRKLRSRYDSHDFTQKVWASFYAHLNVVEQLEEPEALIAYLAKLATNKVIEEVRHQQTDSAGGSLKEWSVEGMQSEDFFNASRHRQPTPSQEFILKDEIAKLTEGKSDVYRRVLEMRHAGYRIDQISDELQISRSMVWRTLREIRNDLSERYDGFDA